MIIMILFFSSAFVIESFPRTFSFTTTGEAVCYFHDWYSVIDTITGKDMNRSIIVGVGSSAVAVADAAVVICLFYQNYYIFIVLFRSTRCSVIIVANQKGLNSNYKFTTH